MCQKEIRQSAKKDVLQFFDLPQVRQRAVLSQIEAQMEIDDYEDWKETSAKPLCMVCYSEDTLASLILFQEQDDGNPELSFLYGRDPKSLMMLFSEVASKLVRFYPGAGITFDALTEESERLAVKLFPNGKTVYVYEAER